jgi:hypothetical protein
MVPRNLSRYIILVSSLAFVALTHAIPLRTDALATHLIQGYMTAYCTSEMGGNVVYVSKIFDVVSPPRAVQRQLLREALHQQDAGALQRLSRRLQTVKL